MTLQDKCKACGQELPNIKLQKEVFEKFDTMCKLWIAVLIQK